MSVFVMIRVELPGGNINDINSLVKPTKPHDGVNQLINLLAGCVGGKPAIVDVATRATTETVASDGGGTSATYNLA